MITVDVLAKQFGNTQVLNSIRFEVRAGETVALLGPSGIGKTTLLRLIAGLDTKFEGHITRPDKMAMVFQEPTLMLWRSAIENIRLVHPDLTNDAALEALNEVGLAEKANLFPGQLSLGQQRRLSLARGFAGRPDLLIMDEPFVSLDAKAADEMLALTERLIAQTKPATIFVTHAIAEAERLATRVLTLHGAPATLVT
ncbi:ABC transporter ATP-binding protein [Yoonia sediminilitoris]|uniref:NitT/TauT family transport system ATP-binding protein n=1 Tax=Yoonia sediminilitoris TaxID=1286148 RepID=A0A2T6KS94_9RHOB|nr:ABC transporter ATP-binding protein [Yoonia sediminilitoris]PUB19422.1 NitT/TauT family transport system ATP-binding protein [Yoonia sediminilitoris]RCW99590.1 NitT/TauT family transport system ATP-binding protein [Yoonia sediminilitoris]